MTSRLHLPRLLLVAALFALACRLPPPGARDPVAHVRVFQHAAHVGDAAHRVLDTISVPLGKNGASPRWPVRLQLLAADLGANAIVLLDDTSAARDGRPRLRAVAIRLADPYAGAAALCDSLGAQPNRVRLEACERAVAEHPADTASWRRLGLLRSGSWDRRGAAEAWARVVALAPGDADAHFQLGCESPSGERKVSALERAIALDPLAMGPRRLLASWLLHEGDRPAAALAHLDTVVLGLDDAEAHYLRGRALLALGRLDEAEVAFRATLARRPTAAGWGALAMAHARRGRDADAVGAWRRALERDHNYFNPMAAGAGTIDGEARLWKALRARVPDPPPHPEVAPAVPHPRLAGARDGRCGR